jgi:error-prone DNA polymerase
LSRSGALASLVGNRHHASWAALGIETPLEVLPEARIREAAPLLRTPSEGEDIVADYANLGFTLGRHPLALLREHFQRRHCMSATQIAAARPGERVRTAGLVISRQRPGTATGVVFVTLEDETGIINLIVWSSLVEAQRRELLHARLLGVVGEVQRDGEVVHLIAQRLSDHSPLLGRLMAASRDFH